MTSYDLDGASTVGSKLGVVIQQMVDVQLDVERSNRPSRRSRPGSLLFKYFLLENPVEVVVYVWFLIHLRVEDPLINQDRSSCAVCITSVKLSRGYWNFRCYSISVQTKHAATIPHRQICLKGRSPIQSLSIEAPEFLHGLSGH